MLIIGDQTLINSKYSISKSISKSENKSSVFFNSLSLTKQNPGGGRHKNSRPSMTKILKIQAEHQAEKSASHDLKSQLTNNVQLNKEEEIDHLQIDLLIDETKKDLQKITNDLIKLKDDLTC